MKFTTRDHIPPRPRPPSRAVEVLGTPEPPTEDFFDLRAFLQGEGVEYLRMAVHIENPDEDNFRALMHASWVGGLDQELAEQLRKIPGFKEYLLGEFQSGYEIAADPVAYNPARQMDFEKQNPAFFKQLFSWYGNLILAIQTFPELKDQRDIQKNLQRDYLYCLRILNNPDVPLVEKILDSVAFFVLLPEQRAELLTALLRPFDGQPELLIANLQTTDFFGDEMMSLLLLFPQQHGQVMGMFESKKSELKSEWQTISRKKGKTTSEMENYFGQALLLAAMTAAKVTVSSEGKFLFELKPTSTAKPTPLPARPLN